MTAALQFINCSVRYGCATALDGVSLEIARGEIVGLLGPNGSGKSTALALAAGLLEPRTGSVTVDGLSKNFAPKIGYVPQETALYDELTAARNLEFFGQLQGLRGYELDRRIAQGLTRARLTPRADDRVERFSGGMKQRLSIACALMHDPVLLLLDEPTAALDQSSREDLFRDLRSFRTEGRAILFSTHHTEEAACVCDRTIALEAGRLVEAHRVKMTSPKRQRGVSLRPSLTLRARRFAR